jgi:hypothetical protein
VIISTPRRTDSGASWLGGWLGSGVGLDAVEWIFPAENWTPILRTSSLRYLPVFFKMARVIILGSWRQCSLRSQCRLPFHDYTEMGFGDISHNLSREIKVFASQFLAAGHFGSGTRAQKAVLSHWRTLFKRYFFLKNVVFWDVAPCGS